MRGNKFCYAGQCSYGHVAQAHAILKAQDVLEKLPSWSVLITRYEQDMDYRAKAALHMLCDLFGKKSIVGYCQHG